MTLIAFTANYTDRSTSNGHQFEFHYDRCHNGFLSTFQPSKLGLAGGLLRAAGGLLGGALGQIADAGRTLQDAIRGPAWDAAFRNAVEEECAPDLQEEISAAQATAAREQVWERARATDQTRGAQMNIEQTASCPHCGAKSSGGKFCGECGKPLQKTHTECRQCGAKVVAGAKFCSECGAGVS